MIKNIRRKVANAISPEKSHSYSSVELKWDRKQLNVTLEKMGIELASTEFIPEHFIEHENTLEPGQEQGQ